MERHRIMSLDKYILQNSKLLKENPFLPWYLAVLTWETVITVAKWEAVLYAANKYVIEPLADYGEPGKYWKDKLHRMKFPVPQGKFEQEAWRKNRDWQHHVNLHFSL